VRLNPAIDLRGIRTPEREFEVAREYVEETEWNMYANSPRKVTKHCDREAACAVVPLAPAIIHLQPQQARLCIHAD